MVEMLPYLNMKGEEPFMWQHDAGSNEFFLYGEFADMRDDEQLWKFHDPLWRGRLRVRWRRILRSLVGHI